MARDGQWIQGFLTDTENCEIRLPWWFHNSVNVLKTTELHTLTRLYEVWIMPR